MCIHRVRRVSACSAAIFFFRGQVHIDVIVQFFISQRLHTLSCCSFVLESRLQRISIDSLIIPSLDVLVIRRKWRLCPHSSFLSTTASAQTSGGNVHTGSRTTVYDIGCKVAPLPFAFVLMFSLPAGETPMRRCVTRNCLEVAVSER